MLTALTVLSVLSVPSGLSVARRSLGSVAGIGTLEFSAPLWRHPGADGWHFVTVPPQISADITDSTAGIRRGSGSVRVDVTVGGTSWRTSIFPDSKAGTYLLPMKKAVRAAERLETGDDVHARLEIVDAAGTTNPGPDGWSGPGSTRTAR